MNETDNIRVHSDLLEIALRLPAKDAAKLTARARTWIQTPFDNFVSDKIGDLMAHLASGGQVQAALALAKEAFALLAPAEEPSNAWVSREPRAWLRDWSYEQAIKTAMPSLIDADGLRTLALFCSLLEQAIELSGRIADVQGEDYSYIWHEAVENDEYPPRLRNTLVSAARDAAVKIVDLDPPKLQQVLLELRKHAWSEFDRPAWPTSIV
jgi:hypothetical protein